MRRPAFAYLAAILSIFTLARCECDEDLNAIAPKIEIGDPQDPAKSICNERFIRDCAYSFGDVPIGEGRFLNFVIKNPSPVDLVIKSITFSDDSDPAFTIEGNVPKGVPAVGGVDGVQVTVRYVPEVAGSQSATLIIESDAANMDPDEKLIIQLTGNGLDLGAPEISVQPTSCNFGQVGVGVTAFCDLTISNTGNLDLEIQSIGFSTVTAAEPHVAAAAAVFGSSSVVSLGTLVAPGTGISVRLWANPKDISTQNGELLIGSNDPINPSTGIPLTVQGAQAPTAVAEVASINGLPNSAPSPTVEPLDDVVLTGVNSVPGNPSGSIVAYLWEITEQPPESSVSLTNPNGETSQFQFSSAVGTVNGLDVAGTFVVRLTVTDDLGGVSTNEATVTLNAIPTEALHVQLSWDTDSNDIDLHLMKDSGPWCSESACYYANCKATSYSRPDWDSDGTDSSPGDPVLDIDDLSGYGPENVNVDSPVDADYTVGVHFYSFSGPSNFATVKVFVNGALRAEYTRQMTTGRDFWDVSRVQWANGAAIVIPTDTYQTSWSCP
jgi:hypothetical protein